VRHGFAQGFAFIQGDALVADQRLLEVFSPRSPVGWWRLPMRLMDKAASMFAGAVLSAAARSSVAGSGLPSCAAASRSFWMLRSSSCAAGGKRTRLPCITRARMMLCLIQQTA